MTLDGIVDSPVGRYRLRVDGQGPPLLLVHGIGPGTTAQANFAAVWPMLATQWTLYAPDLLGFGDSDLPQGGRFDVETWLRQLGDVVDRMGTSRIGVLGQSIGGMLSLALAARDARVASVVTSGAAGGMQAAPAALSRFWSPPLEREAFAAVLREAFHDPRALTDEQVEQRLQTMRTGAREKFLALLAGGFDDAVRQTWLPPELLAAVQSPVLLIHGRNDRQVPFDANAFPLQAGLPRAHLLALACCGHNPLREHTRLTGAAMQAHLQGAVM